MDHRDIFVSHAEEDGEIALGLARELRAQGRSTWIYEEDAIPGISHLIQSSEAIEACSAFLLVASTRSVQSPEVVSEVEQAHQLRKLIVPVRVGLTQEQFAGSNRILRMAAGTAVTLTAEMNDLAAVATRISGAIRATAAPAVTSAVPGQTASGKGASKQDGTSRSFVTSLSLMLGQTIRAFPPVRYALAITTLSIAAAVAGSFVVGGTTPVFPSGSRATSSTESSLSTPHAELIALLEIRVKNIVTRMDADFMEAVTNMRSGVGIYERMSLQDREEAIQKFTHTAESQRQLFLDLHRRHTDALKANQPIVAHEIVGDMYHLLWLQAQQKTARAHANMKAMLEKRREKLPKHEVDALSADVTLDQLVGRLARPGDYAEDYPALSPNASEIGVEPERLQRIEALIETR